RTPPVFHRDLKPANVMFRGDGRAVLVDFGTARNVAGQTHGATLVGTFGYMPPEQLGGTVDASSDLYALAATLVHAVTGRAPAELLDATGMKVAVPDTVDAGLRAWLEHALQPNRLKRFRSVEEAQRALEN